MKKFMLILLILMPFVALSQKERRIVNEVTTVDGQVYSGKIESFLFGKLNFQYVSPDIEEKYLPIETIIKITGEMPSSRMKSILKINPEVKFESNTISDPIYGDDLSYQPYNQGKKIALTGGDYLVRAGNRYLSGIGTSICGGVIYIISVDRNSKEGKTAGGVLTLAGALISLSGHFELVKAGKAFNNEAITISGASQGVGLAINF